MPGFQGFPPEALKFLKSLKRNNDREWFQPRKEQFEQVLRAPMIDLVTRLNTTLARVAPDYISDPAKSIFRIYRDVRFSHDKSPYKTHLGSVLCHRELPRNQGAGFYFHIAPESFVIGGGIYHPPAELLRVLREHVAAEYPRYRAEIRKPAIRKLLGELHGEPVRSTPKGFAADHPAADLLRCRSLFFHTELPPEAALQPSIEKEIADRFRAIAGFVQLLDEPVLGVKRFAQNDHDL